MVMAQWGQSAVGTERARDDSRDAECGLGRLNCSLQFGLAAPLVAGIPGTAVCCSTLLALALQMTANIQSVAPTT